MGFKLSSLKTDATKETEGVWRELPVGDGPPLKLLIARANNSKYNLRLAELLAPYRGAEALGTQIPTETVLEAMRKATSETILLGWENLVDDDDQPVEYSHAESYKALMVPDFANIVARLAGESQYYREVSEEGVVKNS